MRKKSLKTLKRDLDSIFSQYIRKRNAGSEGLAACITCGKVLHWTLGHAGHFIKRQHLATRYDERNSHFQCVQCNTYRGGNLIEYTLYMQKRYGVEVVEELMRLKRTTKKHSIAELQALIEKFTNPENGPDWAK